MVLPEEVYDSGISESRILVFTIRTNFNMIQNTDVWFGNRNFKYVPQTYSQL